MEDVQHSPSGSVTNDERLLVRRTIQGDLEAFAQIMRHHNQRLYRLAVSVLGDASEAEDVLQESYVRAFYQLSHFAGKSSLGTWLAQIVRHEAIDRLRARGVRDNVYTLEADLMRTGSEDGALISMEEWAHADAAQFDPEVTVAREDMTAILEQTIRSLPPAFRTVFVLREIEGLSIQETAEYLGIPPATVKTRDHRARLLLRNRLSEQIDAATRDAFLFLGTRCSNLVENVLAHLRNRKDIID